MTARGWLCVAVTVGTGLVACGDGGEEPFIAEDVLGGLNTNQIVIGLEHYVASEGIREAYVEADTGYFIQDSTGIELRGVRVTFYESTGEVSSVLTAREGTYDWDRGSMVARHDVVVAEPDDGRRVETTIMYFEPRRDRIWSDAPTTMIEPDGTVVKGVAFESDAGLDEVDLTSARLLKPRGRPSPGP